jgi:hypothetical protein
MFHVCIEYGLWSVILYQRWRLSFSIIYWTNTCSNYFSCIHKYPRQPKLLSQNIQFWQVGLIFTKNFSITWQNLLFASIRKGLADARLWRAPLPQNVQCDAAARLLCLSSRPPSPLPLPLLLSAALKTHAVNITRFGPKKLNEKMTLKRTSTSMHDHQDNNRFVCCRLAELEAQGQGAAAQGSPSQQRTPPMTSRICLIVD